MSYIPYTQEQIAAANSVDLPEFLRMRGETLERAGREYKLVYHDECGKHDSITLSGSQWFDHKNQVGGGPIRFMQQHYGMGFQDAMQALLGDSVQTLTHPPPVKKAEEKRQFRLPEANSDMHRAQSQRKSKPSLEKYASSPLVPFSYKMKPILLFLKYPT